MTDAMWKALWQMIVPDAAWNPGWGIEKYWKENIDRLGVPTEKLQRPGEWRLFSKGRIVKWTAQGAIELP